MKKVALLIAGMMLAAAPAFSQLFSLSDSTIVYKNKEGKTLNKDELQELIKGTFSIRQETIDGKKTVTILPSGTDERALQYAKIEAFRSSLIDKPITGFTFRDLDNNKWTSKEIKGKVIVINFWFTSCKPCIQEMPLLNELVKSYKDSAVIFLAPAPEKESQVKKFLARYPFEYKIIPSSASYITKLNVENFPTHLVVDKTGIIRQVIVGYSNDIQSKLRGEISKWISP